MQGGQGGRQNVGGRLGRFMEQLGNPLEWTDVQKAVLLFLPPLPFILFYIGRIEQLLAHPEFEPYIDRPSIERVEAMLAGFLLVFSGLLLAWLRFRKSTRPRPLFVRLSIYAWFVGIAMSSYAVGPFSSPVLVGYLAGGMTAFLLYDARRAGSGAAVGAAVLVGTTILERAGYLPYGPVFAGVVFGGERPPGVWVFWNLAFTLVLTSLVLAATSFVMTLARDRQREIEALLRTDPLTGLANRRALDAALESEAARARRTGSNFAVVMLDLDHFKQVNDTFGHAVGDRVLTAAADRTRACLREIDLAGRYGGEEFLLVLPGTDLAGAKAAAERVREAIAALSVPAEGTPGVRVTVSAGCATYTHGAEPTGAAGPDAVLRAADEALYRAKALGRDRVELTSEPADG